MQKIYNIKGGRCWWWAFRWMDNNNLWEILSRMMSVNFRRTIKWKTYLMDLLMHVHVMMSTRRHWLYVHAILGRPCSASLSARHIEWRRSSRVESLLIVRLKNNTFKTFPSKNIMKITHINLVQSYMSLVIHRGCDVWTSSTLWIIRNSLTLRLLVNSCASVTSFRIILSSLAQWIVTGRGSITTVVRWLWKLTSRCWICRLHLLL